MKEPSPELQSSVGECLCTRYSTVGSVSSAAETEEGGDGREKKHKIAYIMLHILAGRTYFKVKQMGESHLHCFCQCRK